MTKNEIKYFNYSFYLIKELMKTNNKELLEIILKYCIKIFDNEIIINILNYYNNKIPISDSV